MPSNPSLSMRCQRATPASKTAVAVRGPTSSPRAPGAYRNSKIQGLIMGSPAPVVDWPSNVRVSEAALVSSSVGVRNPLPIEHALLGCAAHVGAHWRPQHHEPALVADLAHLFGPHVGRIGAAIDTGDQALAIKCVVAGVGVILADLASEHLPTSVTGHGHHATAAREHEAANRRAA